MNKTMNRNKEDQDNENKEVRAYFTMISFDGERNGLPFPEVVYTRAPYSMFTDGTPIFCLRSKIVDGKDVGLERIRAWVAGKVNVTDGEFIDTKYLTPYTKLAWAVCEAYISDVVEQTERLRDFAKELMRGVLPAVYVRNLFQETSEDDESKAADGPQSSGVEKQ